MRAVDVAYGLCARLSKALAIITLIFFGAAGQANEKPVIVAFGDSLTHGFGLPAGQGFVPQLQVWLEEQGHDVRMVNAGVSGDTTTGGAARIDWTLSEPADAIIIELGGNDLLRGIDPAVSRANLERILQAVQTKGIPAMLVGMTAPQNNGPEYKAAFDAMYPDLAAQFDTVFAPDFFMGFAGDDGTIDRDRLIALMQGDGIHPNAQGVAVIVDALGPYVLDLVARITE